MKKTLFLLLTICMVAVLAFGCAEKSDTPAPADQADANTGFSGQYIVDAEYVLNAMGNENTLLVDARGVDEAKNGTVEGAIAVVWQMFAKVADGAPGDDMWGTLLPAEELSIVLGSTGFDPAKEIIIFSTAQDGWGEDGRIAWGLLAAGYTNVKMVNGGYNALVAVGATTVHGAAEYTPCEVKVEALNTAHIINTNELAADYGKYVIVDVRADKEYQGQTLYGEAAGGHLPGAIHVPFTDLFNDDSTLKSNAEITALFEAAGVNKDDIVVTYCTAGIRSAYAQLILEMCGYGNTINYDESYYHWGATQQVEK